MRSEFQIYDFPTQRIPNNQKDKVWAAKCADWIIAQGQGARETSELEIKYGILQGKIPDSFYKKILNPYNATQ